MNKFSRLVESKVKVGYSTLNSELVYLVENDVQVGSLLLVYEDNKASVFSLEVLKDFRKKGYGRKLMESAITRCKERGFHLVELNTETYNEAANYLYKSLGFQLNGLKSGFNNYTKNI